MIKNIVKNIENNILLADDIEYLLNLKSVYENVLLKKLIINETNDYETSLESNIYYPAIYQIESNSPKCGYMTSFSRQKYTEEFITKSIEYRLSDIDKYNIRGINCYNKDVTGLRELFLILNALDKYDVDANVQLYNPKHLDYLKDIILNQLSTLRKNLKHTCLMKIVLKKSMLMKKNLSNTLKKSYV